MNSTYKIDLHIHTALSPCAEGEMTPPKIVHAARAKRLSCIGVTDHNSAANAGAVVAAAADSGILVVPGLEVQTREEVHLICLFETVAEAEDMQEHIKYHSPPLKNNTKHFGSQLILDSKGQLVGEEDRLLITSTFLTVDQVVSEVQKRGGICIPAHVDRPSYSLLASLGFIPADLNIHCVEVSRHSSPEEARYLFPALKNMTIIGSSDAHMLKDIGIQHSFISIKGPPCFRELKLALEGGAGRKVLPGMKEISLHLIDIVQNSIEAGANQVTLVINEDYNRDLLTLEIVDNGRGMTKDIIDKVTDPFFTTRTSRRIGLGLPLLKVAAERCEGKMLIESTPGKGTRVYVEFKHSHIDRAPLGNMVDTIVNTVVGYPDLNLDYRHQVNGEQVVFDSAELRRELVDVPLNNPAVINWIRSYLIDNYKVLNSARPEE
ncbi:MAG TPA: ATP-binding protein [Bacillota bacterium]|nr:ATP-binding protein [Bacillota bacterium]